MKNIIVLFILSLGLTFCSPTRETIKIPKPNSSQKWFNNKSLKRHSEEFSKKDWTTFKQKDSSINHFLDSLHNSVWKKN